MSRTHLVTGGAGFIGSNYIYYLINKYPEDSIVCVDSLTYAGNVETLHDAFSHSNFTFIRADICNRDAIGHIFEKYAPDFVINFAAESHVDRSITNPQIFLETNIIGTSILMDQSIKSNVKRFHQISTDEVYGDLPLDEPELKFTENTPIKASSPYSSSKASADLLAMAYHRTYGLPVTISRCSNNYGPFQFPEKLIPLMINKALHNEKLPIYGDGSNIRDWLYVTDHCSAVDLIIEKGKIGEVYNIGGSNEHSNIDVVKIILKALNKSENLIQFVKDRKGHDRRYAIDPKKIEDELNWKPMVKFEKGIIDTINWYLDNRLWCDRIFSEEYLINNNKIPFIR